MTALERLSVSYVLPMRFDDVGSVSAPVTRDLFEYVAWLQDVVSDVVVVDGSVDPVFAAVADRLPGVRHLPVDGDALTPMGKVGGVLTGARHARESALVVADDDVRYDMPALERMVMMLAQADLVRPQNYFHPLPWHALWDTSRSLINRMTGGDWPGTLGVRRDLLVRTRGYAGDVMFENLELERTVRAAGGTVAVPLDLYVRRRPPTTRQFLTQRVRQAYDELARPPRLVVQLAILPALVSARRSPAAVATGVAGLLLLTEAGRRRAGGARYFPATAVIFAPLWLLERGICAWLSLAAQVLLGGIPYRGRIVPRAAHSSRELRRRSAAQLWL